MAIHSVWLSALIAAVVLFQVVAVPALVMRKNDLADVLWGPAFGLSALFAIYAYGEAFGALDSRKKLVLALVVIWGARLLISVGSRNLRTRREDVRYAKWRKDWGSTAVWRSYLQVFVLQPLILYVILVPVLYILASPAQTLGPWAVVGFGLWMTGMFFEVVGDEQLRRFKKDPAHRGMLMTQGLWSWTRHPNYFGEVTLWWGIWLIAAELPGSIWTLVGPFGVSYLILEVSGVSMLEDLMKARPGYSEYKSRVPVFFPKPPKRL